MTTKEMKNILVEKLQNESCYFTKSDISIRKSGNNYKVVIKDYEHIPFIIKFKNDDFDKYICVYRENKYMIIFEEGHSNNDLNYVLLRLGYYIGTRF